MKKIGLLGSILSIVVLCVCSELRADVQLLKDINIQPVAVSISNVVQTSNGGIAIASDLIHGSELFRIDSGGLTLVSDLTPGPTSTSFSANLVSVGGTAFVALNTTTYGTELWKTDGTAAGTSIVKDLVAGEVSSNPRGLVAAGSNVFFVAQVSGDYQLFKTDGSAAGTVKVYSPDPATAVDFDSNFLQGAALGGNVLFIQNNGDGVELWKSDGSTAGTARVKSLSTDGYADKDPIVVGDRVYVSIFDYSDSKFHIWASDGTEAGTIDLGALTGRPAQLTAFGQILLFRLSSGANQGRVVAVSHSGNVYTSQTVRDFNPAFAIEMVASSSRAFIAAADTGSSTQQLWASDGTAGGTSAVLPATLSYPSDLAILGSRVVFSCYTSANGYEPCVSDGTMGGTSVLKDINTTSTGSISSDPTSFFPLGSSVIFSASADGSTFAEWTTDGTTAGTAQLAGAVLSGVTASSNPNTGSFAGIAAENKFAPLTAALTSAGRGVSLTAAPNSVVVFRATDPLTGEELYRTDGTSAGTSLISDIYAGASSSSIRGPIFLSAGKALLLATSFNSTEGARTKIFVTDGTTLTPIFDLSNFIKNENGLGTYPTLSPGTPTRVGTSAYFVFFYGGSYQVWLTDGVTASRVGTFSSSPAFLGSAGNVALFRVYNSTTARYSLYAVTSTGTNKIAELQSSSLYSQWQGSTLFYFVQPWTENSSRQSLYRTDGTSAGTFPLIEGQVSINLTGGVAADSAIFVNRATQLNQLYRVFRTDGTVASTLPLEAAGSSANYFYFTSGKFFYLRDLRLFVSDGTSAGTHLVADLDADAESIAGDYVLGNVGLPGGRVATVVNQQLSDGTYRLRLFKSDGTEAGTGLLATLPFQKSVYLNSIVGTVGDTFGYFLVTDVSNNDYLYETDGTTAGTREIPRLSTANAGANISVVANVNNKVVLVGNDLVHGVEAFAYDPDQCLTDPNKLVPGVCGCGTADADANSDGFIDCGVTKVTPKTSLPAPTVRAVVCTTKACSSGVTAPKFTSAALAAVLGAKKPKVKVSYVFNAVVTLTNGQKQKVSVRSAKPTVALKKLSPFGATLAVSYQVILTDANGKVKRSKASATTTVEFP